MTARPDPAGPGVSRPEGLWTRLQRPAVVAASVLVVSVLYTSTLQVIVNGSPHPYATDVGEIQNALPRWGTIHFNGYPLYTFAGSAFVTLLRLFGVEPAAGSSLFSMLWGVVSVGLFAVLAMALRVQPILAGVGAVAFGLSTSMWMDAAIAEVHTLTVALTLGTLLCALRFGSSGRHRDGLWLAFLTGQTIAHQPASALLLPALAVLALPKWRAVLRLLVPGAALALLGPLTYIYLPLRAAQGADWVFGTPNTLDGFRVLALDSKSYITISPATAGDWLLQAQRVLGLLGDDWPLVLVAIGLFGLAVAGAAGSPRVALGLTLVWVPFFAVSLVIWEDRVSDALLAAKLPVIAMGALGLVILGARMTDRLPRLLPSLIAALLLLCLGLTIDHRPRILEVTRDESALPMIAAAEQLVTCPEPKPKTLMSLWGVENWALNYAHAYQGKLPGVTVVSDNVDLASIMASEGSIASLSRQFYVRPLGWWDGRVGRVYLQSLAPDLVSIATRPTLAAIDPRRAGSYDLGNGVSVYEASIGWRTHETLAVEVTWQALTGGMPDSAVAMHLVAQDPPTGPADVLAQDDRSHPVYGWYPVSRWTAGELVKDHYLLQVPPSSSPRAVRLAMYTKSSSGELQNSRWVSLSLPGR